MKLPILFLVVCMLKTACSYHILCLQGVPTRSHYNLIKGIANALLDAGHKVTMVTPFPDKKVTKNLEFIDVSEVQTIMDGIDLKDRSKFGIAMVMAISRNMTTLVANNPALRSALVNTQFDAVINEWFFSDVEAGYAAVQQVPWIVLSGTPLQPHMENLVDTARSVPTVPLMMNEATIPMSFWERVKNTLWYTVMTVGTAMRFSTAESDYQKLFAPIAKARGVPLVPYSEAIYNISVLLVNSHSSFMPVKSVPPNVVEIAGYHISEDVPPLPKGNEGQLIFLEGSHMSSFLFSMRFSTAESDYQKLFAPIAKARGVPLVPYSEAIYNISVLLVNSHSSFMPVKSVPPNVVEIAGYHISEDVPPLPKDFQELLDSSKNGVIYFSMGSAFKSALLPDQTKVDLVKLFGQLPYTVLWKFEETLENMPKNLHIRSWMPQASILAHPNVKVFITHGGLLSTLESLHFGVPTVAIPLFGDQPTNAARSERAGHAIKVDLTDDLAKNLGVALRKMLANDSYYKKAKELSTLFRDRPVSPVKLIQYYVETAIKTKGAYHLRSKALLYKWYELWMLDQLVFFVAILYLLYLVIKKTACLLCRKICKSTDKKVKKH